MKICTASTIRNHPNALSPRIKSLNYLNNILAKIEGQLSGCQEVLMLNHLGEVAECSADNFFLVKGGVLKTPPTTAGALEGVTRDTILSLARDAKIPTVETPLTRHEVYTADECFLTGTGAEVMPVVECDARVIGNGKPGPVTRQLRERYFQLTRQGA
jgi:branched-chain amino acid aminotransferase